MRTFSSVLGPLLLATGLQTVTACGGGQAKPAEQPDPAMLEDTPESAAPASSGKVQSGMDAIAAEDFEKAKAVLTEAVEADPKDPQAAFYLGVALNGLGENDAAVESLKRALELQPKFPEASLNLSAVLLDLGNTEEALAVANAGLENAPEDNGLLQNKAMALLDGGDAVAASKAFETAVKGAPDNEELRFMYAQSLLVAKDEAGALKQLKQLRTAGSVEVLASSADLFGRLKQWDDCIAALDAALTKQPAAELHVKRGLCLHGKNDEDAAQEAFRAAIELDSGSVKAHFYLGHNLRARGDKKGAKAEFQKAAELDPDGKLGQAAAGAAKKL